MHRIDIDTKCPICHKEAMKHPPCFLLLDTFTNQIGSYHKECSKKLIGLGTRYVEQQDKRGFYYMNQISTTDTKCPICHKETKNDSLEHLSPDVYEGKLEYYHRQCIEKHDLLSFEYGRKGFYHDLLTKADNK